MKPSEVESLLIKAVSVPDHPPIFIWGPPGVGKSSVVAQVAVKTARRLIDFRASLRDPTDLLGVMVPKGDVSVYLRPPCFPPPDSTDKWIFFLDEVNMAALLMQHACHQLVLDKRVGDHLLPRDTFVLAAGNRVEDRAAVRNMPAPLNNRFIHIDFEVEVDDWCSWALANGVSAEVVAFIRLNVDLLMKFDPSRDEKAFPTPRSVVAADKIWVAHTGSYVWETIEGTVGKEWTAKFTQYLKIYKELPSVDDILAGKSSTIPTRSDLRYAVAALLGSKAQERHLEAVMRYALKLPVEHGVFLVQLLVRRGQGMKKALARTPSWEEWHKKNAGFVIV